MSLEEIFLIITVRLNPCCAHCDMLNPLSLKNFKEGWLGGRGGGWRITEDVLSEVFKCSNALVFQCSWGGVPVLHCSSVLSEVPCFLVRCPSVPHGIFQCCSVPMFLVRCSRVPVFLVRCFRVPVFLVRCSSVSRQVFQSSSVPSEVFQGFSIFQMCSKVQVF